MASSPAGYMLTPKEIDSGAVFSSGVARTAAHAIGLPVKTYRQLHQWSAGIDEGTFPGQVAELSRYFSIVIAVRRGEVDTRGERFIWHVADAEVRRD